ncbi:hypothetical protein J8273_0662 [Carpediemonas membranifera]|uniref:Uncharacterized protein n=1 Tax=Carpediemonas membranifera TaxID=201153 RepID=A0A8J6BCU3_9EUKA|nr:hypothetical protein J8273_0662 [Carpediemonas membranifera]|eukprot:KAG9397532.1 hypothetical protein J8273_0662 [Carpediemonas membranifera]
MSSGIEHLLEAANTNLIEMRRRREADTSERFDVNLLNAIETELSMARERIEQSSRQSSGSPTDSSYRKSLARLIELEDAYASAANEARDVQTGSAQPDTVVDRMVIAAIATALLTSAFLVIKGHFKTLGFF